MQLLTGELMELGVRLVIFDADGTLRRTKVPGQPCPYRSDEWELIPGVREVLCAIDWRAAGIRIGVASNQDHVGYGHVSAETASRLLYDAVRAAVGADAGEPVIRFCPHPLDVACKCRKPAPGMLLDIMATCDAEPHETLFVGDAECDRLAAEAAGVRWLAAGGWGQ